MRNIQRYFRGLALAGLALGFGIFATIARADSWTMTDADFQSSAVTPVSIDADGLHLVANGAAVQTVVKWDNILSLSRPLPPAQAAAGGFELYLNTGDKIAGQPIGMTNEKLQWQSTALGEIDLPLTSVAAIAHVGKPVKGLEDQRKDDIAQLANGDSTSGVITGLTGKDVTMQAGDATPTIGLDTVTVLLFSTPPGTTGAAHASYRVHLADGTSFTVAGLSLADARLTLKFDEKTTHDIDLGTVVSIEQLDGPVSWLTSRHPADNVYKPFFTENFTTKFDKTVDDGKAISDKFPAFHHGIGCHSYSAVSYDLDGRYPYFRTQYTVDSDSPLADVTVRIKLDDTVAFEQKNVKGGQIYPLKTLELKGAKRLTLEVDYGENYATADRFVWLDPALVKSLPAAAPTTQEATTEATTEPMPQFDSPSTPPATQP